MHFTYLFLHYLLTVLAWAHTALYLVFVNRDGGGVGVITTFGAAGLFVARGSLHAEWALVPLAMNPDVSEDSALKASLVVTRVVLGQRSEDDGAAGKSFFFSKLNGTGK